MKLAELQRHFLEQVLEPVLEKKRFNDKESSTNPLVLEFINSTNYGDAQELLGIYRGSAQHGLKLALADIFPVCQRLVGVDFFRHLCDEYLQQYPSLSFDLAQIGDIFPQFIAETSTRLNTETLPYLRDVALLELKWHYALNHSLRTITTVSSTKVRPLSELSEVSGDHQLSIRFQVSSTVQTIDSKFPVLTIWRANQEETQDQREIHLSEGRETVLIWRDSSFTLRTEAINSYQRLWISALRQKQSLGDIALLLENEVPIGRKHDQKTTVTTEVNNDHITTIEELLPWSIQQGLIDGYWLKKNNIP